MQDEIWHQRSIQNYNGAVLSVYSVVKTNFKILLSILKMGCIMYFVIKLDKSTFYHFFKFSIANLTHLQLGYSKSDFLFEFPVLDNDCGLPHMLTPSVLPGEESESERVSLLYASDDENPLMLVCIIM